MINIHNFLPKTWAGVLAALIVFIMLLSYAICNAFECDTTGAGIPIMITKDNAFGLTKDTTYHVCRCFWKLKHGFSVGYYGEDDIFYPYECGWNIKRRKLK